MKTENVMAEALNIELVIGDQSVWSSIASELRKKGLNFSAHQGAESFILEARPGKGAVYFLDSHLTGISIPKVIEYIRAADQSAIIFVLVTNPKSDSGLALLESGADDCFTPVDPMDYVVAKALNLRKKIVGMRADSLSFGLKLIPEGDMLVKDGQKVKLTRNEYKILEALILRQSEVLSRSALVELLNWQGVTERTIDVHVSSLRRKLSDFDVHIKTFRGKGYSILLHPAPQKAG